MKKISSLTILLALCLGVATSASAQVRFGVKAGFNLANFTGDDVEGTEARPQAERCRHVALFGNGVDDAAEHDGFGDGNHRQTDIGAADQEYTLLVG